MERIKYFSNMLLSEIANEGIRWDDLSLDQQYNSTSYQVLSMCNEYEQCDIEDIHSFAIEELDKRMCNNFKS